MPHRMTVYFLFIAAFAWPAIANADVFNMSGTQTSLQFVAVGDPGNMPDANTGNLYGSVGYNYLIGKYDVTLAQYCQFLSAVAATDTYGLYDIRMSKDLPTVEHEKGRVEKWRGGLGSA